LKTAVIKEGKIRRIKTHLGAIQNLNLATGRNIFSCLSLYAIFQPIDILEARKDGEKSAEQATRPFRVE